MQLLTDPTGGKYFGVEPPGAPGSLGPVRTFAALTGRKPDLIGYYVGWKTSFDAGAAKSAWAYGALYYMAWEPFGTTLASIASGASNLYISRFAQQVKAAGVPIALSFGHEMNGNWYPWGSSDATPASFVAAWRLIHAIFAAAGATNVIWIWNPNVINSAPGPLQPYYPGNSYVDWIGLTGYFPMTGETTFAQLFGPTMDEIRQFTSKPFIIVETAVETGPDEVVCAKNLVRGVKRRSDVLGLVWFEYDKLGVNWSLAGPLSAGPSPMRSGMSTSSISGGHEPVPAEGRVVSSAAQALTLRKRPDIARQGQPPPACRPDRQARSRDSDVRAAKGRRRYRT